MTAYVVLLRGVNVGGRSMLPMATLRAVLTDLGYAGVRTYLQSGNAVVDSDQPAAAVAAAVERALASAVGREVAVVVRTGQELATVVAGWPFAEDVEPKAKHVVFYRSADNAEVLRALVRDEFLPDRLHVVGSHAYLFVPDGLGRSKLAARLARPLKGVVGTARNWNTVTALRDLTRSMS